MGPGSQVLTFDKARDQNRRTENLPVIIAGPWFVTSSPNLAIRQK